MLAYAHALAPGARLQVYEVLNAGDFSGYATGLSDALTAAAAQGATVISMSLRATGNFFCSQLHATLRMHATLEQLTARGISVFAACVCSTGRSRCFATAAAPSLCGIVTL